MSHFSAMDIGRTGMGFARYWMDTLAHNIANANTVRPGDEDPFRAKFVVAAPNGDEFAETGSGVHVSDLREDDREAVRLYAPEHPLADEEGWINGPVINVAAQLTDMMLAQRTHQANVRTVQTAKEAYESALQIGRG